MLETTWFRSLVLIFYWTCFYIALALCTLYLKAWLFQDSSYCVLSVRHLYIYLTFFIYNSRILLNLDFQILSAGSNKMLTNCKSKFLTFLLILNFLFPVMSSFPSKNVHFNAPGGRLSVFSHITFACGNSPTFPIMQWKMQEVTSGCGQRLGWEVEELGQTSAGLELRWRMGWGWVKGQSWGLMMQVQWVVQTGSLKWLWV